MIVRGPAGDLTDEGETTHESWCVFRLDMCPRISCGIVHITRMMKDPDLKNADKRDA